MNKNTVKERGKMNRKSIRKAIAEIAKREGIKKSDVKKEMKEAIMAGYNNTGARHKWDEIFGENKIPSPEEFIEAMGKNAKK